jgi:hypothetical protein
MAVLLVVIFFLTLKNKKEFMISEEEHTSAIKQETSKVAKIRE